MSEVCCWLWKASALQVLGETLSAMPSARRPLRGARSIAGDGIKSWRQERLSLWNLCNRENSQRNDQCEHLVSQNKEAILCFLFQSLGEPDCSLSLVMVGQREGNGRGSSSRRRGHAEFLLSNGEQAEEGNTQLQRVMSPPAELEQGETDGTILSFISEPDPPESSQRTLKYLRIEGSDQISAEVSCSQR